MYITGLDPDAVVDSLDTPAFKLGQLGADDNGNIYQYLQADEAITASDVVVIANDGGASQLDATSGAAGTGTGKRIAVAPASPSQSIGSGDFFWGCVFAMSYPMGGVDSCAHNVELYATATGGKVDDVFDGDVVARGIAFHTTLSGVTVEDAVINFPYVVNTIDS